VALRRCARRSAGAHRPPRDGACSIHTFASDRAVGGRPRTGHGVRSSPRHPWLRHPPGSLVDVPNYCSCRGVRLLPPVGATQPGTSAHRRFVKSVGGPDAAPGPRSAPRGRRAKPGPRASRGRRRGSRGSTTSRASATASWCASVDGETVDIAERAPPSERLSAAAGWQPQCPDRLPDPHLPRPQRAATAADPPSAV
jgi:hypothetical protein